MRSHASWQMSRAHSESALDSNSFNEVGFGVLVSCASKNYHKKRQVCLKSWFLRKITLACSIHMESGEKTMLLKPQEIHVDASDWEPMTNFRRKNDAKLLDLTRVDSSQLDSAIGQTQDGQIGQQKMGWLYNPSPNRCTSLI